MQFSIGCPVDGPVEVGLEDIDSVVLREESRADITFQCPKCGTEITVSAIVPSFLMSAIEALADDVDFVDEDGVAVVEIEVPQQVIEIELDEDDPRFDAYCEYFRRQLSHVECVEDALNEMDSRV